MFQIKGFSIEGLDNNNLNSGEVKTVGTARAQKAVFFFFPALPPFPPFSLLFVLKRTDQRQKHQIPVSIICEQL